MTLIETARKGRTNNLMKHISKKENVPVEYVRENIAKGLIVIPLNSNNYNSRDIIGIGKGLSTKINVNIGGSPDISDISLERKKLKAAIDYKAHAVMDLSVGGKSDKIRNMVLKNSTIPVGTVPIYEAVSRKKGKCENITIDDMFDVVNDQAKAGVDFVTIHCGVTRNIVKKLQKKSRVVGIVSRGGAIMAEWIIKSNRENPYYEYFDRLLDIARKFDITLSLGDGLRPGCIHDATDWAQIAELKVLGELTKRAWDRGVQVMVEGPGHIPLHEIRKNIKLQKKYCNGAPFYVLGPLVTDISPGYDHISGAIGGAIAAEAGADFLCYLTPAEHLCLPDEKDVIHGIIASKIAAHAADIAKGIPNALQRDLKMSCARKNLDWESQKYYALDPREVERRLKDKKTKKDHACTMCGDFCSMKRMNDCL
ncbi:phosphomethylpyrimidine synthase ThiC [bacterium]